MSASNGVVRIERRGKKQFAFGEEGRPFEVDVVNAFHRWVEVDDEFRGPDDRAIADLPAYHAAAVALVKELSGDESLDLTTAEALDFLARLREVYDDLAIFFRPKSPEERGSLGTSAATSSGTSETRMQFSDEPD